MKKTFRFFGMMVAIALASVNFSACSSSDDDEEIKEMGIEQQLVGKWTLTATQVVKELENIQGTLITDVQWFELTAEDSGNGFKRAVWYDNAYNTGEVNGYWVYSKSDSELVMTVIVGESEQVAQPVILFVESVKNDVLETNHTIKDQSTGEVMYQVNFTYKKQK